MILSQYLHCTLGLMLFIRFQLSAVTASPIAGSVGFRCRCAQLTES